MNERIVKLFMKSVDSNYIPLPIEDHIPSWTEKFAELIVRECIKELENDARCRIAGADRIVAKHFGVEE